MFAVCSFVFCLTLCKYVAAALLWRVKLAQLIYICCYGLAILLSVSGILQICQQDDKDTKRELQKTPTYPLSLVC